VETYLSLKIKGSKEEYLVRERVNDKEILHTFNSKDELVNYLKDNIPVIDKKYTVNIDDSLSGTHKLLLKHSTEKAAQYQKKNGFNTEMFETKKAVLETLGDNNLPLEEKSEKLTEVTQPYQEPTSEKKLDKTLAAILTEYCIEMYIQLFGPIDNPTNRDGAGINERLLINLRSSLNLLIQNGFETHNFKGKPVDLISLRNNISRIFMNKMHRLKKVENNLKSQEQKNNNLKNEEKME